MNHESIFSLGVCIDQTYIFAFLFDQDKTQVFTKQIVLDYPLTPGLVTITICELIELIDPYMKSHVLGIAVNGKVDSESQIGNSINSSLDWIDVPLAQWIGPRLKRKVFVCNYKICKGFIHPNYFLHFSKNRSLPLAFGAACFALESFSRLNASSQAR